MDNDEDDNNLRKTPDVCMTCDQLGLPVYFLLL